MFILKISCNSGLEGLRHRLPSQRCKCVLEGETPQDMRVKGSINLSSYFASKVLKLRTLNATMCKDWLDVSYTLATVPHRPTCERCRYSGYKRVVIASEFDPTSLVTKADGMIVRHLNFNNSQLG
jgi:hypothetical protein